MWWNVWTPWDKGEVDMNEFSFQRFALKPWEEIDYWKFTLVRIAADCRDEDKRKEDATWKYWICLWQFDWIEMTDEDGNLLPEIDLDKITPDQRMDSLDPKANPLIKLFNGDYIWWIESYWESVYRWDTHDIEIAQDAIHIMIATLFIQ